MSRRILDTGAEISLVEVARPMSRASVSPNAFTYPVDQVQPIKPAQYDIEVYRGDTYEWQFQIGTGADVASFVPLQTHGWRFKAEIRTAIDGRLMAAMQLMKRDDVNGTITMRLVSSQSRNITGSGVWDLEAITNDGWVRTILYGNVILSGDVTTGFVDYTENHPFADRWWGEV